MDWILAAQTLSKTGLCDPLFAALSIKGLAQGNQDGHKSKWCVTLHDESRGVIICAGNRWLDFNNQKGGHGPVSALVHVLGVTTSEATQWIVEHVKDCPSALALREVLELSVVSELRNPKPSYSMKRVSSI